jgi:hypothetical protein
MIVNWHRPTIKHRPMKLIVAVVFVLALAGSASGYLTASGSGAGGGSVNVTAQPVQIAAASGNTQSLLPTGVASGDVKATIANPNSFPVHVGSLSLDTSQGSSGFSANAAGCALSFTAQSNGGKGWTIPASGQAGNPLTIDLASSLTMGTGAANSCQGLTFTVYLKNP